MLRDNQVPVLSMQGVWPDGTTWKYYENADFPPSEPTAAFGIYIKNNAILLTNNQRGWDIPGGTREEDETIIETMQRELLEEVGLVVTDYRLLGYLTISLLGSDESELCIAGYLVETDQALQPVTGTECFTAKFCNLRGSEVLNSTKNSLIDYISREH
jgi:8-oxo-dGTP pyrophosphatase MutT (NUDIX family)